MYIITMQKALFIKYKTPVTGKISNWRLVATEEPRRISVEQYNNIVATHPFMRYLGGKEYFYKNYTCMGYIPTRLTSVSPDKMAKIVWEFTFEHRERKEK